MRAYLLYSLLIVSVVAMGCGDGKPGTDARDGAGDGKGDGSASSDRADVGGDKPANGGNGGSTTGSAGTGGSTGGDAGTGTAGTGGTSGNDGGAGAGADGGGNDGAAPTCTDGLKNSDETGIDCGGHCGKCAPGNPCLVNTDCQYACRADKTCAACNVAADCPGTESECEHRTCTAGACGSTREAAGTVLAVQSTGDCKRLQCAANGTIASVNDDTDVPDDRNACTNDICTTGTPAHTMLPENSNCGGANHCNATGQCIGCTVAADCPGSDTACRTRTCTTGGVCGYSYAALATKLVDPTARDCKGLQCDGKGNEQVYNEDADLPVDGNVCTTDECSSGTPSHRPVASGAACGGSLVCDGASKCVECLSASTCPGTDAECHTRSCMSGACGVANMAMGTLVGAQTPRDCKKNVCNGQGGVTTVNDDLDLPVDSNACTFDVCTAGTPTNPNVTAGNSCGNNTICDGQGACVTCLTASSCPGTDTDCHHRTCTNGVCGVANATAGMALPTQTAGDCKRSQCDGSGGSMIVNDDGDKPVDGNACTDDVCTAGVPSNPNLGTGTTCGTNLMCNAQGMCVGCITAANCGTDTTCQKHTCSAAGVCGVTNTAVGTLLPPENQTVGDCKRIQCDGQGQSITVNDDADKLVDGNACTKDLCSGGQASNPPEDAGTVCNQSNGTRCNGNGSTPACVQCNQSTDCPGTDTECHHRTCSATGVCGISNDPDGKLVQTQPPRDCKKNICMGGAEVVANDDLDVPVDGNACTNDLCMGGMPSHTPVGINTSCNEDGGTRCNGAGACVVCTAAGQCGTDSFCQTFTCSAAGQCVPGNTGNGTALPPAMQIASDCKKKVCNGAGGIVELADDADVFADGNACTSDTCSNGAPQNTSLVAGTQCSQGGGSMCNGSATAPACVECVNNGNCGTDTQCKTFTCASGTCSSAPRNEGMTVSDAPGDCKKDVCTAGAVTTVNDNDDVPGDNNPCTTDTCSSGTPQNMNVAATVSCGSMLMCDGNGNCVGCITDANCPAGNECQVPVCMTGGLCGFTPRNAFIPVTDTMAGDCHTNECDGAGGIRSVVNTNDTPSANGNECMQGTCNGGAPEVIPQNAGFLCTQDMGKRCDGAGACVECLDASQCPDTGNECLLRTCTLGVCGTSPAAIDTPVSVQVLGDCKDSVCDGMGFTKTIDNNGDAPAPTNECVTPVCAAGNVTPTPKAHGSTCTVGGRTCNGSGVCGTTFSVLRLNGVSSSGASMTIEERKLDGTMVGTTDLPVTASGSNLAIVNSGSASSEGSLSLSGDGRYLIVAGYNAPVGTLTVASAASFPRIVGRIDAASPANVNTTTTISQATAFTGNNVRGATSQDGTGFWVSGAGTNGTGVPPNDGGVWWISLGGTMGPIQLNTVQTNTRWLHIIGGQLYGSSNNDPNPNVFTIGTGLPTTSGAAIASLPGMPTTGPSPFSFVLFDRNSDGTLETMYVSDDGNASNQGVQKWTFGTTLACPTTPCWTRVATHNFATKVDFKGLAGYMAADGSSVTLMATTDEANSRLVRIDEVFTPTPSVTVTQVGMSGTGAVFRGVALSPHL